MAILRITEDTSVEELTEGIANLRSRQVLCTDEHERAELGEAIDDMVALVVQRERLARL